MYRRTGISRPPSALQNEIKNIFGFATLVIKKKFKNLSLVEVQLWLPDDAPHRNPFCAETMPQIRAPRCQVDT
jgi:hypothetical protein